MIRSRIVPCISLLALSTTFAAAAESDWPCWRGPNQDGISHAAGLLKEWPTDGPARLWQTPLGGGFSGISVVENRAYTMYSNETDEMVICLDTDQGNILWQVRSGTVFENQYGDGPRATPAIDSGHVYTHGATGSLLCLDTQTGKQIWGFNTLETFGGENLDYGFSASPVIVGQMLVVVVGAPDGKSLVALDKSNGEVLWTSLSDQGGYSTPLAIDVNGTGQLVVMTGKSLVGVAQEDGRELWRHPWKTTEDANVATPIYHDGRLFVSSGYGTGCAVFELSMQDGKAVAEEAWSSKKMKNYFSTSVLLDGHLYGFNNTRLVCMNFENGDVLWQQRGFNRGSLLVAEEMLYVLGERGTLALAKASPGKYEEVSQVEEILQPQTWTVPTIADGKMFLRNEKEIVCLDLSAR